MRTIYIVAAVLVIHASLITISIRKTYTTFDEPAHLAAGLAHWQHGEYSYYRANPPLVRMLATIAPAIVGVKVKLFQVGQQPGERPEWPLASEMESRYKSDYFRIICLARLVGILWSVTGGLLIYWTAASLYGRAAGYTGLLFWSFDPTVLANASLITTDVPAAVAALATTLAVWRWLDRPSANACLLMGFAIGIAISVKFSLLMILPIWCVAVVIRAASLPRGPRWRATCHIFFALVASLFVVNAVYQFDGCCVPLKQFRFVSRLLGGEPPPGEVCFHSGRSGNRFADSTIGAIPVPLPAEYLLGIDLQQRDCECYGREHPLYLNGTFSDKGSVWFYCHAISVKWHCTTILYIIAGFLVHASRTARVGCHFRHEAMLWAPIIVISAALACNLNLQFHRYLLPVFPFAFIVSSKIIPYAARFGLPINTCTVLFATLLLVESAVATPYYLSYCNLLRGGPGTGHRHLIDANMDWGQDLLELKAWADEHGTYKIDGLAYYGSVDPGIEGIHYELPPALPIASPFLDRLAGGRVGPRPGTFAISASLLQGLPAYAPDGTGRWVFVPQGEYTYFNRYRPVAKCGQTIFIYQVSNSQANQHRQELGLPPLSTDLHQ